MVEDFGPAFEADQVDAFLARQDGGPFFLFYNVVPPHMPLLDAPERYTRMYSRDDARLRDNVWRDGRLHDNEWDFNVYLYNLFDERRLPDGFDLRDLTALYYGMVSCVDDSVGRLMDSLRRHGLERDTVVVFLSDHGDQLGSHHRMGKALAFEESMRVPLLFHAPELIPAQRITRHVAQQIDLMPTLLSLVGAPVPGHVHGRNLAPVLLGEAEASDENFCVAEMQGWIGVRTPRFKYVVSKSKSGLGGELACTQFHDLQTDAYELSNLAESDEQTVVRKELHDLLTDWDASTPWLHVAKE